MNYIEQLTVKEFNDKYPKMAVANIMDINKHFVICKDNKGNLSGVLIYKTEAEALNANRLDKVQRDIIYIKKG